MLDRLRAVAIGDARRGAVRRVARHLPVVATCIASLVLALVLHRQTIHAPTLRAALETTLTGFALSAAWLLRAQFVESRRLRDLLLLCAALALGLMTFCIAALPAALDLRTGGYIQAAAVCGQLAVASVVAAAAVARPDTVVVRRDDALWIAALLGLAPIVIAAMGGLLLTTLGLSPTVHGGVLGRIVLLMLVVAASGLLITAATAFALRESQHSGRIGLVLAIAASLLAGACLSRLSMHPLRGGQLDAGAALRAVAFALILGAALTLERRVHARAARAAALAERRRVARDLHDGLAQDLAFIAAHGAHMAGEMGDEHPVVIAARRALAISRSTISELADPAGTSTAEALDAVAQELRERFDIAIAVNAHVDERRTAGVRDHLSRIVREAIANAARHGQARNVLVSLRHSERGIALRVIDDGCGIPSSDSGAVPEGFGLRSMRERAGALGGSLSVRRVPEGGTEVEVVVP